MTAILAVLLATAPVEGEAAFSYRIESAAEVRGLDLGGLSGCAVLDCDRVGERAWVRVAGVWTGPYVVVDCVAEQHRPLWSEWGRVVDLPWSLWDAWDLPLAPFPVALSFGEPERLVR